MKAVKPWRSSGSLYRHDFVSHSMKQMDNLIAAFFQVFEG
jgi:hypothetical protein